MLAKGLLPALKIRLITNGSLMHRPGVQAGVAAIGQAGGEIWFKVDRVGTAATEIVNAIAVQPEVVKRNLQTCADLAPTWVQTCWFALDGQAPDEE
ncbi:MAG TPA: radical SAM protein, partial [Rhodocyclaceae bacterium]|nr:radical SAM protein [Rhodocyclaceae bacterium]